MSAYNPTDEEFRAFLIGILTGVVLYHIILGVI